jgi:hypothetical protein
MIVAIDNGLDGGLCVMSDGHIINHHILPTVKLDKGRRIDGLLLYALLASINNKATVYIEKPVGSKSVNAAKSMAASYRVTECVCELLNFKVVGVTARSWQKLLLDKGDTKEMAAKKFTEIYPALVSDFSITAKGNKSKNLHDGMIDAALIAYKIHKYGE